MINPYTLYCVGFIVALLLYALGWSDAYPSMTVPLGFFILVTLLVHAIMARYWSREKQFKFYNVTAEINPVFITAFIYVLWIAEFIYQGIPLFNILLNKPYDHLTFGIPALHVLLVTISSFYTQYLFHLYLSNRKKIILLLYLINLFAAVLIYSRSMFFFNITGSLFLYLFSLKKIQYKRVLLLIPIAIGAFYLFGIIGNKRLAFQAKMPYDASYFLETGRASQEFRESPIPKEFFWSYIYISSPLANLQANILYNQVPAVSPSRVLLYINNEYLFESISKRVNRLVGVDREKEITIKHPFNVSTVYSRSYSYIGWPGIIGMGLFVLVLPIIYCRFLSNDNPFALTGYAVLCTMYLFLVYDNTIRLMGLGFQLVYPFVFAFAGKFLKQTQ